MALLFPAGQGDRREGRDERDRPTRVSRDRSVIQAEAVIDELWVGVPAA
jgi:hypothetical protein